MAASRTLISACAATAIMAVLFPASLRAETHDLVVVTGSSSASHRKPAPRLNVSLIATTSSVVSIGSPFSFRLMATAGGFGHLYVLSASGKVQLWTENLPVRAHEAVAFPSPEFVIRAAPPAGDETVVFIVTRKRFAGFAGRETASTPLALQYSHNAFRKALDRKTAVLHRRHWAKASTMIRVK